MCLFYRVVGCIRIWRHVSFEVPSKVHGCHNPRMLPSECRARDPPGIACDIYIRRGQPTGTFGNIDLKTSRGYERVEMTYPRLEGRHIHPRSLHPHF